jgi:hypothetical protein
MRTSAAFVCLEESFLETVGFGWNMLDFEYKLLVYVNVVCCWLWLAYFLIADVMAATKRKLN